MKQADTATAALVQRVQERFNTDIETAEYAVRKMQKALSAAMKAEKNTANESGVKESETTHNKYGLADLSNEKSVYDYYIMKNLPPMDVAIMPDFRTVKETERVSSSNAIEIAMKDAASIGKVMDNGNVVVQNKYTECGIVISRTSLKHSLNGGATRLRTNVCLAAIAGQLV